MVTKRIVVLANSVRHAPCRCVAGREVLSDAPPVRFGDWVRPISGHGQGELYEQEIKLDDKSQPRVLDVVDVHLQEGAGNHVQPENWLIARRQTWNRIGRMSRSYLSLLEETPPTLWHRRGWDTRRIPAEATSAMRITQSLYLIRPRELRIRLWTEAIPETESERHRRRAVFHYHGIDYNLSVTDPIVTGRYEEQFPAVGEAPREDVLPWGDDCLLCVSLTREYNGWHYKVVATVIEL